MHQAERAMKRKRAMKKLTVEVAETPRWLAYRCQVEAELNDMASCPFAGAVCPLGLVSCRTVTEKDWEEVLKGENDAEEK